MCVQLIKTWPLTITPWPFVYQFLKKGLKNFIMKYIWLSSKERLFHTTVVFFSGEPACFPSLTFWTPSNCHKNYFCFMSRMFKLPRKCSRVTSENLVSPEKKTLLIQFCKIQIGLKQKPIYLKSVVLVSTPVVNLGSPLALNTSLQQVP